MAEVPCLLIENLTDKQIRRLRILDNKLNESEWDIGTLKIELEDLEDSRGELEDLDLDFCELGTGKNDNDMINHITNNKQFSYKKLTA